jgi:flagellar basal body-associated protein FliL
MSKPTIRKKRSKLKIVLLSPLLIVVFIVGWGLYFIGQSEQPKSNQQPKPNIKKPERLNEIELIVIPQEESQIVAK